MVEWWGYREKITRLGPIGLDRAGRVRGELWFFAVFSGIPGDAGKTAKGFANPKGIEASSPGLRASRYPGWEPREITTLKGLNPASKQLIFNPFRVVPVQWHYPG